MNRQDPYCVLARMIITARNRERGLVKQEQEDKDAVKAGEQERVKQTHSHGIKKEAG